MKFIFPVIFISFFFHAGAQARTFTVEKSANFNKRAEEIKEVIIDVENTCSKGCKYKISNISEIKIVDTITKDDYYTWTFIDSVRNSYSFGHIQVRDNGNGEIIISNTTPSKEKIKDLNEKSGHSHRTPFDDITSHWTIKENFDQNHEFINSTVTFSTKMVSDSTIVSMFSGLVRSGLDKTAEELFENIGR